jgi:glycosyltransferase involved in cell wall biosynthesis
VIGKELVDMRVLMFGWEFPPFKTGGLGTACYGLTRGLKHMGVEVTFVVPKSYSPEASEHVKVIGAKDVHISLEEIEDYTHVQLAETSERVNAIAPQDIHTGLEEIEDYTHVQLAETSKRVNAIAPQDIHTGLEEMEDYTHVQLIKVNVHLSPYTRLERHSEVQEVPHRSQRKIAVTNTPSGNAIESKQLHGKSLSEVQEVQHRSRGRATVRNMPSGNAAGTEELYGKSLSEEIEQYTAKAGIIAQREKIDMIHAHDWMTFQAGIEARKVSGKPLVIHIHSTEYDRTGGWYPNPVVCDIEQTGAREADQVMTVSNKTKRAIMENYGIPAEKISVVYNAIDADDSTSNRFAEPHLGKRIVLFLGRITLQKGPDYFLEAASKVLEKEPDVMFVMAGNGDMMYRMIERAGDLNMGHKVLFTGFLKGPAVDRMYDMADVYVMPSVSEPFGITPLEAMSHGVPVVISKQSGVSEVIKHALKVDFWDVDKLADRIISVLRYRALRDMLGRNGKSEMRSFSWDNSAIQCINVYNKTLERILPKGESHPSKPKVHAI